MPVLVAQIGLQVPFRSRSPTDWMSMPLLKIEGFGSFDVDEGQRLVNALIECGVDIGHRCGGNARCTTCRVRFSEGEPDVMTRAEYEKIKDDEQMKGKRLSCQIVVDRPMAVEPLMLVEEMGWDDGGPQPEVSVQPEAKWYPKEELA